MKRESFKILRKNVENFYANMTDEEKNTKYFGHWYDHVSRVVENVKAIIRENPKGIEKNLVIAAALCHDLAYGIDKANHPRLSSKMCVEFLKKAFFTDREIIKIKTIILSHSRKSREPRTVEEKTVYIADKLDMLGIDGLVRMYMQEGIKIGSRDKIAERLLEENKKVTNFLLSLNIANKLIQKRWEESKTIIEKILKRKKYSIE